MRLQLGSAVCLAVLAVSSAHATPDLVELHVIEAHGTRTRALAFDHAGKVLVSGGSDRKLQIYDAKTLKLRATWTAPARDTYEP